MATRAIVTNPSSQCHHRSPKARDRWHPHLGWDRSSRPWLPAVQRITRDVEKNRPACSPRCPNARHLGHPSDVEEEPRTACQGLCYPRCPNARHLGHPSFVGELTLLPRHPGHPPIPAILAFALSLQSPAFSVEKAFGSIHVPPALPHDLLLPVCLSVAESKLPSSHTHSMPSGSMKPSGLLST